MKLGLRRMNWYQTEYDFSGSHTTSFCWASYGWDGYYVPFMGSKELPMRYRLMAFSGPMKKGRKVHFISSWWRIGTTRFLMTSTGNCQKGIWHAAYAWNKEHNGLLLIFGYEEVEVDPYLLEHKKIYFALFSWRCINCTSMGKQIGEYRIWLGSKL